MGRGRVAIFGVAFFDFSVVQELAMKSVFALLMAVLLSNLVIGPAHAAEARPSSGTELNPLQGQWERELTPEDLKAGLRRAVKEIKGNKETVTFYGEDNKLLRRHTVDFKLEKNGDIRVFTYFNMEVTDGDGKGNKRNDPVSYVYRVYEDRFFEVTGLLPGQEQQAVTVFLWKRLKKETQ